MVREILRESERLREEITGFARELVRTPSESLGEAALADRVEEALVELGYHLVVRDDFGNVVGVVLRDEALPTVLLSSHMDTVACGPGWTRPPLEGRIEGGRLYGLGAADCKGGLAAQIYAGHVLSHGLLPLRGNLVVAATVAEENGCGVGLRHLLVRTLPELELAPTFAILGEPTGLALCYGHDGWAEVEVAVEGRAAEAVRQALDQVRRAVGGPEEGSRGEQALVSVREAEIPGGELDRRGAVRVLRRILHGESARTFARWVERRIAPLRGLCSVEIEVRLREEPQRLYTGKTPTVRLRSEPWTSNPFDPLVDRARDALVAAGVPPVLRRWQLRQIVMGTGGGLLARRRIPVVGFGPGEEAQAHAPDESLDLDRLVRATYATAVLAHAFIGAPVVRMEGSKAA